MKYQKLEYLTVTAVFFLEISDFLVAVELTEAGLWDIFSFFDEKFEAIEAAGETTILGISFFGFFRGPSSISASCWEDSSSSESSESSSVLFPENEKKKFFLNAENEKNAFFRKMPYLP